MHFRECKSRYGEYHFLTRQGKEIMNAIKMETCRLATEKIEMSDESARSASQNGQTNNTANKDETNALAIAGY